VISPSRRNALATSRPPSLSTSETVSLGFLRYNLGGGAPPTTPGSPKPRFGPMRIGPYEAVHA
jgi:hypothetical protein